MKKILLVIAVLLLASAGGYLRALATAHPARAFGETTPPPAPDYSRPQDWLAFPGRNGFERSSTAADTPVPEAEAAADVDFSMSTSRRSRAVTPVSCEYSTAAFMCSTTDCSTRIFARTRSCAREPGALPIRAADSSAKTRRAVHFTCAANSGRALPVSNRLLRFERIFGQPPETASINFDSGRSISCRMVSFTNPFIGSICIVHCE